MHIVVNGETQDVPDDTTVAGLLVRLGLGDVRAAVEVNRGVVPRARHGETSLAPGDRVEVVRFVGGG